MLAACASAPPPAYPPVQPPPVITSLPTAKPTTPRVVMQRGASRWVQADWNELPGWDADTARDVWPALIRGCVKPPVEWVRVCSDALQAQPASDAAARAWLAQRLQPWRVEASDGRADGLLTGYFEPLVEARRQATGAFHFPLYGPPSDLAKRRPYWTRQQIDTLPAAQASLYGRAFAYVADPLDALVLQVQGSGRLNVTESNGQRKLVRVAFAGHNDHPYQSVGRWLINRGELKPDQASWPGIREWARSHPARINELLWANPRYVFFREEPLPDANVGPRGAQNVPLTPGRSVAVDAQNIPYGSMLWLDSTEPLSNTPLRRLVMAQDTGSAITGAVRADYFWGWGNVAEQQAGRMKQALRVWVLWPRS